MSEHDVARRLTAYLEQHLFAPVLGAAAHSQEERRALHEAQELLRREHERLRRARHADEVYRLFHEALARPQIAALEPRLHALGLPALEDLRIDFEQMASDLGIGTSGAL